MNLYRSFGNLMEAWVTETDPCMDPAWLENNDEDPLAPTSEVGTNLRSESVDSGVETGSSVMSFPATPSSVSAEMDTFTEKERLTPASTSQSPVLSSPVLSSSSSPTPSTQFCPSRSQEASAALHLKLEQALQKTDSISLKKKLEPTTVDEVLRRRPRTSFLPKRHTSELVRGQRSESFGLGRIVNPSAPLTRQKSDMCRRPKSMCFDKQLAQTRLKDLSEEQSKGLSPGLCYLEQVCQMLEEVAKQQMHSRALQIETDALREQHQDVEALSTCQTECTAAEDLSSRLENTERAENSLEERQQQKDKPSRHFRQRSASDTNLSTLHLRRLNADYRGQHLSRNDLLEKEEEDYENQESEKEETTKSSRNWMMRFGSLTRDAALRDTKGKEMQPSEKNSARRRLSQLFRRRRKTQPV